MVVGSSIAVPPGVTGAFGIGVGPLKVSVLSGRQFEANRDKPFEFTLNPGLQGIIPSDDGIVAAQLSGTIAGGSTVSGALPLGQTGEG
jgi:hypothetical protein